MVRYAWYGEPWFLAGDVCRALGIKNARDAVNEIGKKLKTAGAKGVGIADTLIQTAGLKGIYSSYTLLETAGGKQQSVIITEQVLYELIFDSRKHKETTTEATDATPE